MRTLMSLDLVKSRLLSSFSRASRLSISYMEAPLATPRDGCEKYPCDAGNAMVDEDTNNRRVGYNVNVGLQLNLKRDAVL